MLRCAQIRPKCATPDAHSRVQTLTLAWGARGVLSQLTGRRSPENLLPGRSPSPRLLSQPMQGQLEGGQLWGFMRAFLFVKKTTCVMPKLPFSQCLHFMGTGHWVWLGSVMPHVPLVTDGCPQDGPCTAVSRVPTSHAWDRGGLPREGLWDPQGWWEGVVG